ncbi:pyridoxamine 5'-phosphate oxidase family protein [Pseudonocardia spinosispora]|uniref:pyridoxamine 5'-phosphate oxidase family protein n=1 Tax=Pseudonocardia spinosispora TaxID=103441 RepID=UPI0004211E1A|nr:pyridoxamine 5'-phosphate oxidase family protein [Pseudonocardia spinosispora]
MSTIPPADSTFGAKLRVRFDHEMVVWLTTVDGKGVPQPNPVWFIAEESGLLVYNQTSAARLRNIADRPAVAMNFNNGDGNGDIVVLTGIAEVVDDVPAADAHETFMRKYRHQLTKVGFDPAGYAQTFPVPLRVHITGVRGT